MEPISFGSGRKFMPVDEDVSVQQTNEQLVAVQLDLEAAREVVGQLQEAVQRDSTKLKETEAKVAEAAKAISIGNLKLTESQMANPTMKRIRRTALIMGGVGLAVGIVVFCAVPTTAGIVTIFVASLGAGLGAGGVAALK